MRRRRDRPTGGAWERFASEDPLFFIDPRLADGVSLDEFVAAGGALVQRELAWAGALPGRDRVLEIGCGIGRTAVHFASHFDTVEAVDVSPRMIELAEANGPPGNVRLRVISGHDLSAFAAGSFDLVFAHLVFQHIPKDGDVAGYLREIERLLKPVAPAVIQFDTRPRTVPTTLAQWLPNSMLGRRRRPHMRRYRRSAQQIRAMARDAGLEIDAERGAGTEEHWLRLRRRGDSVAGR